MSEGTFQKVNPTNTRMFGPEKILVCGFPMEDRIPFGELLARNAIQDIPVVFAATDQLPLTLGELLELPDQTGADQASEMPRAVILSGLTHRELHTILQQYPSIGLPIPLWATLTEMSVTWPLSKLLQELIEEREFFSRRESPS